MHHFYRLRRTSVQNERRKIFFAFAKNHDYFLRFDDPSNILHSLRTLKPVHSTCIEVNVWKEIEHVESKVVGDVNRALENSWRAENSWNNSRTTNDAREDFSYFAVCPGIRMSISIDHLYARDETRRDLNEKQQPANYALFANSSKRNCCGR